MCRMLVLLLPLSLVSLTWSWIVLYALLSPPRIRGWIGAPSTGSHSNPKLSGLVWVLLGLLWVLCWGKGQVGLELSTLLERVPRILGLGAQGPGCILGRRVWSSGFGTQGREFRDLV